MHIFICKVHKLFYILFQVMFKHLYSTAPAGLADIGTLFAARNAIQARQVSKDPKANFYATADLLLKFTEAHLIAGAMSYFSMANQDDTPKQNSYEGDRTDKAAVKTYIKEVLEGFVSQHVLPDMSTVAPPPSSHHCDMCGRTFVRAGNLHRHKRIVHHMPEGEAVGPAEGTCEPDYLYNYTKCCLTLGLIKMNQDNAIKYGDGARLVRLYKLMYLYYKVSNCPKYAYGTLELLVQTKCLLSPRLAHRLVWNRFANNRGLLNTNLPLDLDVEHHNKQFKADIHTFRGELSEKTIDRVSKSLDTTDAIVKTYAKHTDVSLPSGRHTDVDFSSDVALLAAQYHEAQVFANIPGRAHSVFQGYNSNPLSDLNMTKFHKWLKESIEKYSTKHYYNY